MTETIGWGDVDVDEAPPRRRRVTFALIWIVIAAVVAGVALWPKAKSSLADRAAHWLHQQWNAAQALDASRTDIELAASQRVAAGDIPTLIRLVQNLDREEADRLTAMASAIGRHRMWAHELDKVRTAVRRAYLAQAHDLRADVGAAPKELPDVTYVENPYTPDTEVLLERAATALGRMATSRHLKSKNNSKSAKLTSASEEVAELQGVTAAPVDLHLAVMLANQLDVWDLRTGKVRSNVLGELPLNPPVGVLHAVGSAVLAQFDDGWELWPTTGARRPIRLPNDSPDGFYQPAGDTSLWRTSDGSIRRYDATGHPVGPWHHYPAALDVGGSAATEDAVLSNRGAENFNDPHPVLWYPETGRVVDVPDPCLWSFGTGPHTLVYVPCQQTTVRVLDTRTGRVKSLPLPHGWSVTGAGPVVSSDGTRVALTLAPRTAPDEVPTTVYIVDVAAGRISPLHTSATPLAWSSDGSVLLLDTNGSDPGAPSTATGSVFVPLAYWKPGMTDLAGIRITVNDEPFAVAVLP